MQPVVMMGHRSDLRRHGLRPEYGRGVARAAAVDVLPTTQMTAEDFFRIPPGQAPDEAPRPRTRPA